VCRCRCSCSLRDRESERGREGEGEEVKKGREDEREMLEDDELANGARAHGLELSTAPLQVNKTGPPSRAYAGL
jgi:hypothetical protein